MTSSPPRYAPPTAVGDRGAFLQDVAAALQGQELGDGRSVQRRYYDAPAGSVITSATVTVILIPELLELAWRNAPPGREAAISNELMREL